jgi:hypothetical protein
MPWESVIRHSAEDERYWQKNIDLPAMRAEFRGDVQHPTFQKGGIEDTGYRTNNKRSWDQMDTEDDDQWQARPKGGKAKGKGTKSKNGKNKNQNKNKSNKGTENEKRTDGRFTKSNNGVQLCFGFNRNKGGCSTPCPTERAHYCEWCRQPHRAIDCPKHPGWVPPVDHKSG